jgi:hypothetical protein
MKNSAAAVEKGQRFTQQIWCSDSRLAAAMPGRRGPGCIPHEMFEMAMVRLDDRLGPQECHRPRLAVAGSADEGRGRSLSGQRRTAGVAIDLQLT